jgi:hypothetical protein
MKVDDKLFPELLCIGLVIFSKTDLEEGLPCTVYSLLSGVDGKWTSPLKRRPQLIRKRNM